MKEVDSSRIVEAGIGNNIIRAHGALRLVRQRAGLCGFDAVIAELLVFLSPVRGLPVSTVPEADREYYPDDGLSTFSEQVLCLCGGVSSGWAGF